MTSTSPPSRFPASPARPPPNIAYFDQLDDTTVTLVCDKLATPNDNRSLGRFVASGKRFRALCQGSLDKLEERPTAIDATGSMFWRDQEGQRHRNRDKPAVIFADGTQEWWWHGKKHREGDKPAVIFSSGTQEWWLNGQRHREGDQPAAISAFGTQEWWFNGQRHREGGRPAVVHNNELQEFWVSGRWIE